MRTMYVTRTKVLSKVTVKFIGNDDNITTEEHVLSLRSVTEKRAERELNKQFAGEKKVIKIVAIEPLIKRYRMEESVFLRMAEEIEPLKRDKERFLNSNSDEEAETETETDPEIDTEYDYE